MWPEDVAGGVLLGCECRDLGLDPPHDLDLRLLALTHNRPLQRGLALLQLHDLGIDRLGIFQLVERINFDAVILRELRKYFGFVLRCPG